MSYYDNIIELPRNSSKITNLFFKRYDSSKKYCYVVSTQRIGDLNSDGIDDLFIATYCVAEDEIDDEYIIQFVKGGNFSKKTVISSNSSISTPIYFDKSFNLLNRDTKQDFIWKRSNFFGNKNEVFVANYYVNYNPFSSIGSFEVDSTNFMKYPKNFNSVFNLFSIPMIRVSDILSNPDGYRFDFSTAPKFINDLGKENQVGLYKIGKFNFDNIDDILLCYIDGIANINFQTVVYGNSELPEKIYYSEFNKYKTSNFNSLVYPIRTMDVNDDGINEVMMLIAKSQKTSQNVYFFDERNLTSQINYLTAANVSDLTHTFNFFEIDNLFGYKKSNLGYFTFKYVPLPKTDFYVIKNFDYAPSTSVNFSDVSQILFSKYYNDVSTDKQSDYSRTSFSISIGDFNGDNIGDFVLALPIRSLVAYKGNEYGIALGRLAIIFGSKTGKIEDDFEGCIFSGSYKNINDEIVVQQLLISQSYISSLGDVNNDGFDDLFITISNYSYFGELPREYTLYGNIIFGGDEGCESYF